MNGGRSNVIIVLGFLCFASVICQDNIRNCTSVNFYCPKTDTCDSLLSTDCNTSICSGLNKYPCEDGANCFGIFDRCDTVKDCLNGADEMLCSSYRSPSSLKCLTSKSSLACRSTTTTTVKPPRCGKFETECDGGRKCYSTFTRCDGTRDCSDGLDEKNCPKSCNAKEMRKCEDGNGCYRSSSHCDGVNNCRDDSDERDCDVDVSDAKITDGEMLLGGVATVVLALLLCCCRKGSSQCSLQCSCPRSSTYRLRTYDSNTASTQSLPADTADDSSVALVTGHSQNGTSADSTPPNPVAPSTPTDHPPASASPGSTPPPASAPPPTYESLSVASVTDYSQNRTSPYDGFSATPYNEPTDNPPASAPPPSYESLSVASVTDYSHNRTSPYAGISATEYNARTDHPPTAPPPSYESLSVASFTDHSQNGTSLYDGFSATPYNEPTDYQPTSAPPPSYESLSVAFSATPYNEPTDHPPSSASPMSTPPPSSAPQPTYNETHFL